MYDPTIGRWLSQDPMSFAAGDENLYRFEGNNPTNETDPSGLETLKREIVTTPTNDFTKPTEFEIKWMVPQGQSGWIIQQVEFDEEEYYVRAVGGELVKATLFVHPKGYKYWEAWKVIDGKVYATKPDPKGKSPYLLLLDPVDTFTCGTLETSRREKGKRIITGNAVFLKDYELDIQGGGWGFDVREAGLLATKKSPKGWDELSRDAQFHFLEVIYDNLNSPTKEPLKGSVRWFPYNTDPNWRIPVDPVRIKE